MLSHAILNRSFISAKVLRTTSSRTTETTNQDPDRIDFKHRARLVISISLIEMVMFIHDDYLLTPVNRELTNFSVLLSGLMYAPVAILSFYFPHRFNLEKWRRLLFLLGGLGCILYEVPLFAYSSPASFLISDALLNIGRMVTTIGALKQIANVQALSPMPIITSGIALAYLAWIPCRAIAMQIPGLCSLGMLLAIQLMRRFDSKPETSDGQMNVTPPSDLDTTNPFSFIPLASHFYVCIALFEIAFGYSSALTFGLVTIEQYALCGISLLLSAFVVTIRMRHGSSFSEDHVFSLCSLIITAGLILSTSTTLPISLASGTISVGGQLFYALTLSILTIAASNNPAGSLVVISSGLAVSTCASCLGFALEKTASALEQQFTDASLFAALVLSMLLLGYELFNMRAFSFHQVLSNIVPAQDASNKSDEQSCDENALFRAIATEYDLTAREIEIAALLAKGRNGPYIEQALVISRGTVKTHVRHIYKKLNIHSQQELIDLFGK